MENQFSIPGLFYKYRSLENLERFLSIIIDRKLYGALYSEMNDPMEGYYKYDPKIDKGLMENIVNGKKKTYICSLSRSGNIGLMWTHYANENKGCCLEVEVTSKTWREVEVKYSEQMLEIDKNTSVEDVLKTKARMWSYEQETRFLSPEADGTKKNRPQLTVQIKRILIGCNVDRSKMSHLKKIINALDEKIEIVRMRKSDLDYGYNVSIR